MTIAAETNKVTYNCDGSKTEFDFTFKVFQTSNIKVILITVATGAETVLTETTHYAITGSLSSGGKVTTVSTYSSLYKIFITIDIDLDQETDLVYGGSYSSEAIETMADKLTKIAQQFFEKIKRSITFKMSSDNEDIEIEDLVAGKTIVVNSAGDGLEMGESGGGGGGGLDNVVEDTTPQLGGNLDMNGKSIGGNTEAQIDDAVSKKHTQLCEAADFTKLDALGTASTRNAEDTLTDGSNLPDGAAIKTYGDTNWSSGGGGLTWELISTNTNAVNAHGYLINASGGNITLTLPSSPSVGDTIGACDAYNKATTNTITVARNTKNIEGAAEDLIIDSNGSGFTLVYTDVTRGWEVVSEITSSGGGSVDTFGTPVDNDFAKFTDADTIEGRSYSEVRSDLNVEDGADVTDAVNVASAGALMDSEVDADIKTFALPANTTISTAGKALIDDASASAQRTTLGLGSAATRSAEDSMTDGANLPDGHAIKTYGDSNWGSGGGYDYIVTTKTAAAINTAIDLAYAAGGGTVLLSSGEYDCTGVTYITMKDNVTLSGYGATLKSDGGLSNVIYATGLDNAKILGITINGQYPTSQGSTGENGIQIVTGDNITIKDCYIYSMEARGIVTSTLTDSLIANNHIVACYMGIRGTSPLSKLRITENLIEDTYAGGITLSCAYNSSITDVVIADNIVDLSVVGETILAQNIVCYSDYSGETVGTIRGITVTGNTLIGNGTDHEGLRMGGDQITIIGNKIYNTSGGIAVSKSNSSSLSHLSTNTIISGNTIKKFPADGTLGNGIFVWRGDNIAITGNTLYGGSSTLRGIRIENTTKVTVVGNSVHTVTRDGILFQNTTYAECQNNVVYNSGANGVGYGITLDAEGANSSDYIVVANNQLNGNPDGALINSSAGTHIKIYNNHGNDDFHGGGGLDNIVEDITPQLGGDLDCNSRNFTELGNTYRADNKMAYFGTGNDMSVYHSGTGGYIINTVGSFYCYANATDIGIRVASDAGVSLYHNGVIKLATTSTGITVTGSCSGCDYVFEPSYNLLSLDDLGKFVEKNEHLPDLTIAQGYKIDLSTMREELVAKVEEQALYILQLHKRLKTLEQKEKTKCK